jgi:hypothetical protein
MVSHESPEVGPAMNWKVLIHCLSMKIIRRVDLIDALGQRPNGSTSFDAVG